MPKRKSACAEPQKPDKRILRSKLAVLAATYELLTESGLGGVSIDEVAARSGVAKTTIYRHWPSRSALLVDACSKVGSNFDMPDTGTLRGDLLKLTAEMAARLRVKKFSSAVPSVIDAAERDPEIAAVYARVHAGFMAPLNAVIERAQKRGELPRTAVPAEIVAAIAGPLFYRRWFSRERLDDRFVQGVVERALLAPSAVLTDAGPQGFFPSDPSSAWARNFAKLCFASTPRRAGSQLEAEAATADAFAWLANYRWFPPYDRFNFRLSANPQACRLTLLQIASAAPSHLLALLDHADSGARCDTELRAGASMRAITCRTIAISNTTSF